MKSKIEWVLSEKEIEERNRELKVIILKILSNITPGIPTQLSRIAQLSEQQEVITEEIIKEI
jgi:hypothetical protein